jgi:hypothetical protein
MPSTNVLMNINKEVDLMPSENTQKAFDADKAETFSEKLLTAARNPQSETFQIVIDRI